MMALDKETPTYQFCSGCNKKYINDEEHIKQDFGYNRLTIRYKSCIQCKARYLKHRESHREERSENSKTYYQENKDIILDKRRIYRDNNKDKIIEKSKIYYEKVKEQRKEMSYCELCGAHVTIVGMRKHITRPICKNYADKVKKCESYGLWKLKDGKMVKVDGSDENIENRKGFYK